MFSIDLKGCTRIVFLTKNYAFKIPNVRNYKLSINGILANLNEAQWTTLSKQDIVKSFYCNRFGLLNIQERVKPVIHRGLFWVEVKRLEILSDFPAIHTIDIKPENYGYKNGSLLKIDLG